jgi:hypothetical protein
MDKRCAVCHKMLLPSLYVSTVRATCIECQAKRRRQYAARVDRKKSATENMQAENEDLAACQAEQAAEIKRLQAVLTAFRNADAISDQHLHHLWTHPEDTVAIGQFSAIPVLPVLPGQPGNQSVNNPDHFCENMTRHSSAY